MKSRKVPSYSLQTYDSSGVADLGIYVRRFEILERELTRPAGVHRHEHCDLFWLRGRAEHVNDFARTFRKASRLSPADFRVAAGKST